jgi:dipeptidyl aminopeptidase/acylaminoacyl peptidase
MGSFHNLLGERFEELSAAFSVDKNVSADTCPCFLFHTMEDAVVPVQNTFRMLEALRAHNIPAEAYITQYGYHGVGLAKGMDGCEQWPTLTLDWLRRLCK